METNKHTPPVEPPNEANQVAEPAAETVELNAAEQPTQESGVARPSIKVTPASGASTHPTG